MGFGEMAVTPKPADIETPDNQQGELDGALSVPLPEDLRTATGLHVHETMETNPIAVFKDIGDYVLGTYEGFRVIPITGKEGTRDQRIYDIRLPRSVGGTLVSFWGSKILDNRMDAAVKAGLAQNRSVMVQYLGDLDTGQVSPAHNFRVVWK